MFTFSKAGTAKASTVCAALLMMAVSSPAAAMSEEAAACPAALMDSSSREKLAEFITSQDERLPEAITLDLAASVTLCSGKYGLDEDETDTVMDFTLVSLIAEVSADSLNAAGLPVEIIQETLDVGPGRANVQPLSFTEEDAENLVMQLTAKGINAESFSPETWNMVGVYLGAILDRQTILASFRE